MLTGKVVNWKADKGFGFITPDGGGPDAFLHVSELGSLSTSAIHDGLRLDYETARGPKGPKAVAVRIEGQSLPAQQEDGQADFLTTEEFGREVTAVLDRASIELQQLAKRHGWVE